MRKLRLPVPDLLTLAGALLLTAWVQRQALGAFFTSPDDLIHLQQAVDLRPTLPSPFRFLSQSLYFRIMVGTFGVDPAPFHAVTYLTHLVNVALTFGLLRRVGIPLAVTGLAATLFGTMPLSLTLLSSAVGMNDLLALGLTLAALIALRAPGPLAVPAACTAFTLGLFCKESVLFLALLPIVMRPETQDLRSATRRTAPLLVISLAVTVLFFALRPYGLVSDSRVYPMQFGMNLFHNLMTYIKWGTNLVDPMPDMVSSYDTAAWPPALVVVLVLAAGWRFLPRARMGIGIGASWWLLGLLPVLPLRFQSYRHYLYPALPGLALAAATMLWALLERLGARGPAAPVRTPRPRVVAVIMMVACALGYSIQANHLILARLRAQVPGIDLSADPVIRRRRVAAAALSSMSGSLERDSRLIALYAPTGTDRVFGARTGREYPSVPGGQRPYDLLAEALDQGWAIRLFYPQVESVAFLSRWSPEYEHYDLFLRQQNEYLLGVGKGPRAHERAAEWMLAQGWPLQTSEHLGAARLVYPDDKRLGLLHATALLQSGDTARAAATLGGMLQHAPEDTLTREVRRRLQRIRVSPTR